ncbi:MAG TPA: ISKra4 family transposase [Streptosporangiaceae bacterium]
MEAAEAVIRAGLLRLGGSMLEQALAADRGHRGPRVPCGRGHEAVFEGYRDKSFDTVLGLVTLTRAWYHCAECGHGLAPRDAELGIAGASMSPGLAAMNDKAAAAVPFARAASLLEELAGIRLTAKRAERAAEASGAAAAKAGRDRARLIAARRLVPLPPSPLPDKLYAVIDGTGVPMTSKETAGREGKGEDGRARTREVKLAVFFTQDRLDKDGYPVRDRDSASVIATFEPARAFADLVKAEGIRRGADHVRQFTILGDGAAWIWNIATARFPEATQIVDLFHAREHLHDLARSLEFMLGDRKGEWLAARLEDLDYGYIDGITAAAREFPLAGVKKDEMDTALGYFENNAPRMRYHWFRQCGLFVGSGVVEASCKTVIGQRLKQSGMHWTVNGADAIIALRCKEASSPREAICNMPRTQMCTA